MEETGCKIICGAPTTLTVEGQMVMMMMITDKQAECIYTEALLKFVSYPHSDDVMAILCFYITECINRKK